MSSASLIINFMKGAPKLEESSYSQWSAKFLDVLTLFGLTDYVLKTKTELLDHQGKAISTSDHEVQRQDQCIRFAICQLVPDKVFHLVKSNFTAKECWDNLMQFYSPNPTKNLDEFLEEFWQLESHDDVSVDTLIQQLSDIRSNSIITDDSFCGYVLRS